MKQVRSSCLNAGRHQTALSPQLLLRCLIKRELDILFRIKGVQTKRSLTLRGFGLYKEGKSPLRDKGLPVTLTSHWASLSHLAFSSSLLAHCLLLPACPWPSPTSSSLSSRHFTFAFIIAVERRRRRYPVTRPNSLLASRLPFLNPLILGLFLRMIYAAT